MIVLQKNKQCIAEKLKSIGKLAKAIKQRKQAKHKSVKDYH